MSSNKIIYVKFGDTIECIEFNPNTSTEDLKETFRTIAECEANDILKLYNSKGHLIAISNKLESTTSKDPYRLEVVIKHIDSNTSLFETVKRIENLENRILSTTPYADTRRIDGLEIKINDLTKKLENVEHLSWLGLFKDTKFLNFHNTINNNEHRKKIRKIDQMKDVYQKLKLFSISDVSNELKEYIKKPAFDNWQFDDVEMLVLLQQMYIEFNLTSVFSINIDTLQDYLYEVYSNYNDVPFHNFKHAFVVTQMMYGLLWITNLKNNFEPLEILSLLVSAVSHDLDHDGYNNSYQINAHTPLSMIYNDQSPLEMYHCAVAFGILSKEQTNIVKSLTTEQYKIFRSNVIECILATDMANHNKILNEFKSIISKFDYNDRYHRLLLMKILMKTADISNESRPINVSETWLDCLLTEFFNQGDHEKLKGLPISPLMDRETVSKPSSQIGFISYVLLPLVQTLAQLFPQLNSALIEPIQEALSYYKKMDLKVKENVVESTQNHKK